MVVAAGGTKLGDITFEDIRSLLSRNRNLRGAVIRLLAQKHSGELIRAVKIVPNVAAGKKAGKAKVGKAKKR